MWKSKGALHAVLVHILWVDFSPKTAILVLHVSVVCMCVQKHS